VTTFDIIIVLFIFGFFVLGFAQGTIRRLLGIASMLFSFLFAANVRQPLGDFLANNWRQFPPEYSYMIGFGAVFVAGTIAFTIVIQGFYKSTPLFEKARFADELIGGVLGALQAVLLLAIVIVILDSFFVIPGIPQSNAELLYVRDLWNAIDGSQTGEIFRESVLPAFFTVIGIFIPADIERVVLGFRS
jgi:membrane protein required for colicin V production